MVDGAWCVVRGAWCMVHRKGAGLNGRCPGATRRNECFQAAGALQGAWRLDVASAFWGGYRWAWSELCSPDLQLRQSRILSRDSLIGDRCPRRLDPRFPFSLEIVCFRPTPWHRLIGQAVGKGQAPMPSRQSVGAHGKGRPARAKILKSRCALQNLGGSPQISSRSSLTVQSQSARKGVRKIDGAGKRVRRTDSARKGVGKIDGAGKRGAEN